MGKMSLNFTDPFGVSTQTLNVDDKIVIKELAQLLAEELGHSESGNHLVGGLFKNPSPLPVIYDPKMGVLSHEESISHFGGIKNNATLSYYIFPPNALSPNDIFLENNSRLGTVSVMATVEWSGNYYPVLLPSQITREDVPLAQLIFAQLRVILGIQAMPPGWRSLRWQLYNVRTGERIDGAIGGNVAEKIHHGDLLRLSPKIRNEQDEIVFIDEKNEQASDELEIKIGDDLLESITIEQATPKKIGQCAIELVQGDITFQEVDAIVNAAKTDLTGGAGVDGAIHQAAGPSLVRASQILAPCIPGKAVLTPGFSLPAKWVIHTVGPRYQDGKQGEEKLLASAYRSSLAMAFYSGFESIAFPAISTGVYGYPVKEAARVTWKAIADAIQENKDNFLKVVRVVVLDDQTHEAYASALNQL